MKPVASCSVFHQKIGFCLHSSLTHLKHDIFELNVAVYDADLMYVINGPENLHGELRRLGLRDAPARLVVEDTEEVAR